MIVFGSFCITEMNAKKQGNFKTIGILSTPLLVLYLQQNLHKFTEHETHKIEPQKTQQLDTRKPLHLPGALHKA